MPVSQTEGIVLQPQLHKYVAVDSGQLSEEKEDKSPCLHAILIHLCK